LFVAGIDVGSVTAKAVILDKDRRVLSSSISPTGAMSRNAADKVMSEALAQANLKQSDISHVIATGYGRHRVSFAHNELTEITCHARGANYLFPQARTVIDIGGQDSKVIGLDEQGLVRAFAMNDKCAAGTGRFLEVMARALEVDLDDMGKMSLQSQNDLQVSSVCTVFAESEVISLVADGRDRVDIIAGIHKAITRRIMGLVENVGLREEVVMTGGVAKNIGVVRAIEDALNTTILLPEDPQIVGALGAAIIALEMANKVSAESTSS